MKKKNKMTIETINPNASTSFLPFGNLVDLVRGFKDSSVRSFTWRENTAPLNSEMEFIGAFTGYLLTFPIFLIHGMGRTFYSEVSGENHLELKYYNSQLKQGEK